MISVCEAADEAIGHIEAQLAQVDALIARVADIEPERVHRGAYQLCCGSVAA
jgi:hypothetical protein